MGRNCRLKAQRVQCRFGSCAAFGFGRYPNPFLRPFTILWHGQAVDFSENLVWNVLDRKSQELLLLLTTVVAAALQNSVAWGRNARLDGPEMVGDSEGVAEHWRSVKSKATVGDPSTGPTHG